VHLAADDCERLGRAADIGLRVLAARPLRRLDRTAVLRARRQQSAVAGLVRSNWSSRRTRSLLPLRVLQYRQLPRTVVLSIAGGAALHLAHAESDVDRRVWHSDPVDRL